MSSPIGTIRKEPSDLEKDLYYEGLPSQPKLVAQSGLEHGLLFDENGERLIRQMKNVGAHAIVALWEPTLEKEITDALRDIAWNCIDILRIGTGDWDSKTPYPVVLFVAVEPGSTSWERADAAACRCHEILCTHNVKDVHCEIRESVCMPQTDGRLLPVSDMDGEQSESNRLFSTELVGQCIAPSTEPTLESSICAYLAIGHNRDVCALVCRHGLFKSPEPMNQDNQEILAIDCDVRVFQPGNNTFEKAIQTVTEDSEVFEKHLKRFPSDPRLRKLVRSRKHDLAIMEERRDLATREIGRVFFVQPRTLDDEGWLHDWGLVKLDEQRYSTALQNLKSWAWTGKDRAAVLLKRVQSTVPQTNDPESTILLKGTIPKDEIFSTTRVRVEEDALWVFKSGKSSRFTCGISNEIRSIRRPNPTCPEIITKEWCIISDRPKQPFSQPGDSGSPVFDGGGRLGGIITSGCGRPDAPFEDLYVPAMINDVTYATPIEVIFQSLEAKFGKVELL